MTRTKMGRRWFVFAALGALALACSGMDKDESGTISVRNDPGGAYLVDLIRIRTVDDAGEVQGIVYEDDFPMLEGETRVYDVEPGHTYFVFIEAGPTYWGTQNGPGHLYVGPGDHWEISYASHRGGRVRGP